VKKIIPRWRDFEDLPQPLFVKEGALKKCQYCHFDRREKSVTMCKRRDFSSPMLLEMTKFKALKEGNNKIPLCKGHHHTLPL
jgi:hypothetical protein